MDNALRMHNDFYLIRRQPKQPHCFYILKSFVHQRRGIDSNFCPHRPIWMAQSVSQRNVFKLRSAFPTERTARSGQNDFGKVGAAASLKRLKNCAMFAVDRQQANACPGNRLHNKLSAGNKRFLVGKRDGFPRLDRGKRRPQADHTDDSIADDIVFR